MLSGILNLKWKWVKNLGQRLQALFTGTMKSSNLACSACKIGWEKHQSLCRSCWESLDLQLCLLPQDALQLQNLEKITFEPTQIKFKQRAARARARCCLGVPRRPRHRTCLRAHRGNEGTAGLRRVCCGHCAPRGGDACQPLGRCHAASAYTLVPARTRRHCLEPAARHPPPSRPCHDSVMLDLRTASLHQAAPIKGHYLSSSCVQAAPPPLPLPPSASSPVSSLPVTTTTLESSLGHPRALHSHLFPGTASHFAGFWATTTATAGLCRTHSPVTSLTDPPPRIGVWWAQSHLCATCYEAPALSRRWRACPAAEGHRCEWFSPEGLCVRVEGIFVKPKSL
jgi:hypothetical protein